MPNNKSQVNCPVSVIFTQILVGDTILRILSISDISLPGMLEFSSYMSMLQKNYWDSLDYSSL